MASHTRSLNDTDIDLGTRDLIMEVIGLNVPIHDRDEFSHGDHVNGRGDVDSTLLPSEDVRSIPVVRTRVCEFTDLGYTDKLHARVPGHVPFEITSHARMPGHVVSHVKA
ncbi:hypothetical protein J1N35_018803 [Gossypium stocksii]|uniref:Uncharacterized protein n=1 Tax=Gossypium stocksii TaxID=47602 RepID=A0A9D3VPM5_9ROSI|nr:hypothetical protein J1N35_018803 [Gossypium stocksii]